MPDRQMERQERVMQGARAVPRPTLRQEVERKQAGEEPRLMRQHHQDSGQGGSGDTASAPPMEDTEAKGRGGLRTSREGEADPGRVHLPAAPADHSPVELALESAPG